MNKSNNIIICNSINELPAIAEKLLSEFSDFRIFALFGNMGVGKTTFIKTLCGKLGVSDNACSPSFGIVHQYATENNTPVYHFDFYRIKKIEEAYDIGYEDYFFSGNYCFIEWPEKVDELLPEDCIKIYMEESDNKRIIRY